MDTVRAVLGHARRPDDLGAIALAGVIGMALARRRQPMIPGLSEARFQKLLNEHFIDLALSNGESPPEDGGDASEFADLLQLLLEHRARPDEQHAWIAYAVASASMDGNHLWEDMGLPSRRHLSELMRDYFPPLAAKNEGGAMKWKKFFYRQLCERAEVAICKSPHCADCVDYGICFSDDS